MSKKEKEFLLREKVNSTIMERIASLSPERRILFEKALKQKKYELDNEKENRFEFNAAQNVNRQKLHNISSSQNYEKEINFSLLFFSNETNILEEDKYKLVFECARFADQNGFHAIWTPERHFKHFGANYPNPAILSAALAMCTDKLQIRAGSVVLPLQNPLRIVEDWAVVDNLSNGRVGIAFASGWHPDDFVLSPDNYSKRRELMYSDIKKIKSLWQGVPITLKNGKGQKIEVTPLPRPVQETLPVWITASKKETFLTAGKLGTNILTGLIEQSIEECAEKINLYRKEYEKHHPERSAIVTLMLHTYIDECSVMEKVKKPFTSYLKSFLQISEKQLREELEVDSLTDEDQEALFDYAFKDYYETRALFGSPESCQKIVNILRTIGVDEIACLIDFGLDDNSVLSGLRQLNSLKNNNKLLENRNFD